MPAVVTAGSFSLVGIGFGVQTALNTPVAASMWLPLASVGKIQPMIKAEVYPDGTELDPSFNAKLGEWWEFDFTTQLRPSACAKLLQYALGTTDAVGAVTGTMSPTTTTGAANTQGTTTLTLTATANAAINDVLLVSQVTGSLLSEYVIVKTVTSGTVLQLFTPLQNTYAAASTAVNANASINAHYGFNVLAKLKLLTMWAVIGINSISAALDTIKVADCQIMEVDIVSDGAKMNTVQFKGIGRTPTPGQSFPTITYETDRALTFADAAYAFASGLTITGATADITKCAIHIKNAQNTIPVGGNIIPFFMNGKRDITCDFSVFAEDIKPFRDVFFGGDSATAFTNANTVASNIMFRWDLLSTPDHFFQISLGNVVLTDAKPTADPQGKPFELAIKGQATQNPLGGGAVPVVQNVFQYLVGNADVAAYT